MQTSTHMRGHGLLDHPAASQNTSRPQIEEHQTETRQVSGEQKKHPAKSELRARQNGHCFRPQHFGVVVRQQKLTDAGEL